MGFLDDEKKEVLASEAGILTGGLSDVDLDLAYRQADLEAGSEAKLSPQERIVADRLVAMVVKYVGELGFLARKIARMIAGRLVEKLKEGELEEDAVGVIGEGVWQRLNAAGEVGNEEDVLVVDGSAAEQKIVDDIIGRVDGYFSLIEEFWQEIVTAAGSDASDKLIRVVAKEAWPKVRRKLGL